MSGLGNEDFRRLVAESTPQRAEKKAKKKQTTDKSKSWKKKPEEDDGSVKYRDRAEERRRGLNVDYQELQQEQKERGRQWEKFSAEETKFLGGDMDRAHLVKGLDYQLLQKVKLNRPVPVADVDEPSTRLVPSEHPATFATAVGRAVYETLFRPPASSVAEMFKPKRMAYVFFDENAPEVEEQTGEDDAVSSIPYTLIRSKADCPQPRDCMNAAPDTAVLNEVVGVMKAVKIEAKSRVSRKKGQPTDVSLSGVQQEKERRIMNLKMIANPRLAVEAAAQRPLPPPPGAVGKRGTPKGPKPPATAAADVSIFDDVDDDYVPSDKAAASAKSQVPSSYFSNKDTFTDLPKVAQHGASMGNERHGGPAGSDTRATPPYQTNTGAAPPPAFGGMPPPSSRPVGGKGSGFTAKMGDRAVVRHKFSREQRNAEDGKATVDASGTDDVYGVDFLLGGGGLDEEDEDLNQMDQKGKTLNRADFETDDQFNNYKSSREAAPKAAFQFGIKMQDGRRSQKDMDSRKQTNKIENQLGKIHKVFEDKGYKAGKAFQQQPPPEAEATPSRKKARLQV